jgi:phosphohistidine phosphatase SixA
MRILPALLGGLVATVHLAVAAPVAGPADKLADLSSVLAELRAGGLVIFFRHGATDQTSSSEEAPDMARCETQRNLSAEGRRQATQIGHAFLALGIPVGTVTTSPFCRAKDTAHLGFGSFEVSADLYFAIGADAGSTRRNAQSLRRMLATAPPPRSNAVIVSHTANLAEAAGIWPKPEGVAYIFRPGPSGAFEAIAVVMPDEWDRIARLNTSGRSSLPRGR